MSEQGKFGLRVEELLDKFGRRLYVLPFTEASIPSREEVELTKEIWAELSDDERQEICLEVNKVTSSGDEKLLEQLPNPEPFAMRLTYKYLKDIADQRKFELGEGLT
ncbi:hypothetical protein ACFLRC_01615 [Candidatus Altiarchaeota archaeon]